MGVCALVHSKCTSFEHVTHVSQLGILVVSLALAAEFLTFQYNVADAILDLMRLLHHGDAQVLEVWAVCFYSCVTQSHATSLVSDFWLIYYDKYVSPVYDKYVSPVDQTFICTDNYVCKRYIYMVEIFHFLCWI